MDFLKQLNEEYRLFNITDDGIEEIDIDSLLNADDFDDEGHVIDDSDDTFSGDDLEAGAPLDDTDGGENTYNLRKGLYNKDMSPNLDDGMNDLDDDEYDEFSFADNDGDSDSFDIFGDDQSDITDMSNMDNSDEATFDTENPNNYNDDSGTIDDPDSDIGIEGDLTGMGGVEDMDLDIPDFDDISDEEYHTHMNGGASGAQGLSFFGSEEGDDSEFGSDEFGSDESDDYEGEEAQGDLEGVDSDVEQAEEDPNFQGVIRTVKGANLVYKRQNPDGTFSELWIQNIGKDMKRESEIRRAVLAGTDIPPTKETSDDGTQTCELTTLGNVQFLRIDGLPS